MIVMNSLVSLIYLVLWGVVAPAGAETWVRPVLVFVGLVNVIFAVALIRWRRWGFWGFAVSTVVALIVNVAVLGLGPWSVFGVLGIAALYGLLQLGRPKAWLLLE